MNSLKREVGLIGAAMMGLGSIVGTGVFVSIGIGAEVAGGSVLLAIFLASLVAICNGLSSAQLAANHPVSGGTYEYGYRWLSPTIGFVAGWTFLVAKSASAATAALGFAGYLNQNLELSNNYLVILALGAVALMTAVTLLGISRTSWINTTIVAVTLFSLFVFVLAGFPTAISKASGNIPLEDIRLSKELLEATALMFVAFTGYGRIATLGEEIKNPRVSIPRAIIFTLLVSMLLYFCVGFVALANAGADSYGEASLASVAPLQIIANGFGASWIATLISLGAMTAMLGVLLNLILGLSRVLLAMGRRNDMPSATSQVSPTRAVPYIATLTVAGIITSFVLSGNIKIAWSFSAFTVLIYYAVTNACAIRLSKSERLYPAWISWCGLSACLFLAFWVEPIIWGVGLGLIAIGLLWKKFWNQKANTRQPG